MKCKFCALKKHPCCFCTSSCLSLGKTWFCSGAIGQKHKQKISCNYKIPQIDGGNDEDNLKTKQDTIVKKVYAANCEIYEVSVITNFLSKTLFISFFYIYTLHSHFLAQIFH